MGKGWGSKRKEKLGKRGKREQAITWIPNRNIRLREKDREARAYEKERLNMKKELVMWVRKGDGGKKEMIVRGHWQRGSGKKKLLHEWNQQVAEVFTSGPWQNSYEYIKLDI